MTMRMEQLRAFAAVVRTGSFTRAADAEFMTQPSLSRQIAALEREVGAPLLVRHPGAGGELTAAGEVLLPIARRILADEEDGRRRVAEVLGLRRGRVRIGAPPTVCATVLPEVFADFHARHPGIELEVSEAGSRQLVEELARGAVDLAVTVTRPGTAESPAVTHRALFSEELVVASAREGGDVTGAHGGASMTLAAVAREPLVAFGRSYDLRAAIDAAFETAGLGPRVVLEGAEMDAVLRFVERGLGVAVVPATVLHDQSGLRLRRLTDPVLRRTVNLSRRAGVEPGPAVLAMERAFRHRVDELVAPGQALRDLVVVAEDRGPGAAGESAQERAQERGGQDAGPV